MFERALKRFGQDLEELNCLNKAFTVELAKRQLEHSLSGGFGFVSICSNSKFLGKRFDTIKRKISLIGKFVSVPAQSTPSWGRYNKAFLKGLQLVECDYFILPYSEGRCYQFSLSKNLLLKLLSHLKIESNDFIKTKRRVPLRHKYKFENTNGNAQPIVEVHRATLNKIKTGLVNLNSLKEFTNSNIEEALDAKDDKTIINCFKGVILFKKIIFQEPIPTRNEEIYEYPLAYYITGGNNPRPQDRTGLQNIKGDYLKKSLMNVEFCNYDIKASNFNMLEKLMRDNGIDNSWIITFLLNADDVRNSIAEEIGVDYKKIKMALQAIGNGASFNYNPVGSIFEALEVEGDLQQTKQNFDQFLDVISGFKEPMNNLTKLIKKPPASWLFRGKFKNAIGQHFDFEDENEKSRITRSQVRRDKKEAIEKLNNDRINLTPDKINKLEQLRKQKLPREQGRVGQRITFLVTGLEQLFIQKLIQVLPEDNPIYVLKHDGFICKKPINQELIMQIKTECDLPYLQFEQETI